MKKEEIEIKKKFINQNTATLENYPPDLKVSSSIYRIKNEDNFDINKDKNNNKVMVKKILHNSDDKNADIHFSVIGMNNFRKSISHHNSRDSSNESNGKKTKIQINNRYKIYENNNLSDNYDEISERNNPMEKPNQVNYHNNNDKEALDEVNQSSEIRKIMLRSSIKNIKETFLKEEQPQTDNRLKYSENIKKSNETEIEKIYLPYKKDIKNTKCFIILFSIGILLSIINIALCSYLQLYGNQDVYIILSFLSLILIALYIFGIIIFLKDKKIVLFIIEKKLDPEIINQSKKRKALLLFLYLLILVANYYYIITLVNTSFLNNIKLSIRGKGYDIKQWTEYFSDKSYTEILTIFEKVNIFFLIFGWLNWILMIFIIIYKIILICNYRLIKSIIQVLCISLLQAGIFQIYFSLYCYKFRDVTSLEGIKLSWATPGTMSNGFISIFLGFFGFYVFYIENKKKIIFFEIFCIIQIILLLIFGGGLTAIGDKFYNYKKATCNSLFKFISEDYILKYKSSVCKSKYLFNSETLDNIQCPKDRIMINWEITEQLNENQNKENIDDIGYNDKEKSKISFGCINQSCCLQIYYDIKNKFDFLLILCIHQVSFYLLIFITGICIHSKINNNLQEEIVEKKTILFNFIISILIYIIVIPFIIYLPNSSNQSLLNKVKNIKASEDLSIIGKDLIDINKETLLQYTNYNFNYIKQDIINKFKYNIILEYLEKKDYEYQLSYYEYILTSFDLNIKIDYNKLENINAIDIRNYSYTNLTKKIIFKSKTNIINNIFDYLSLHPYHPLKNYILFNIEINGIFIKTGLEDNITEIQNKINKNYNNINITKDDIKLNYNETSKESIINIIKKDIDFSLMNKNEFFYLRGNVINDNGKSLINVYNYYYNQAPIYSIKTDNNGSFKIGPLYKLNNQMNYFLNIEIKKIKIENKTVNINNETLIEEIYIEDTHYCKYYDFIKISDYGFHSNEFYSLNNIILPEYITGYKTISGYVKKYEEDDKYLSDVLVKIFYGNNINRVNEYIENNQNSISPNFLDEISEFKTSTDKEGKFSLNINKNGQYIIIFVKEEYYLEKHVFTINDISSNNNLEMGIIQFISLFNSGKIVVKLEWDNKPPDLDLICRFQVTNEHYCYTFFGNKKCVETEYFLDSRQPNEISSEVIEINEFSNYVYLFYIRKYFDYYKGITMNEDKKDGVENGQDISYNDIDIKYNEYLNNTRARILIYTNGFKVPALKINLPAYLKNTDNHENFNYWSAFCINGNKGIGSLKIINQLMENEPPRNICSY